MAALHQQFYSRLIAQERRSPLTAETYRVEARHFLEWLAAEGLEPESVDSTGLAKYLDKRRTVDCIDSRSAVKVISVLRSFFRFMVDESIREDNPASILETPRRPLHLPELLSREAVEGILAAVNSETPLGLRDRTIFELIYSAGIVFPYSLSGQPLPRSADKKGGAVDPAGQFWPGLRQITAQPGSGGASKNHQPFLASLAPHPGSPPPSRRNG